MLMYGSNQTNIVNQFSSVQSLIHVQLFATPWTAAHQASLAITNSHSLLVHHQLPERNFGSWTMRMAVGCLKQAMNNDEDQLEINTISENFRGKQINTILTRTGSKESLYCG